MRATVVAVHRSSTHSFSKPTVAEIELLEGLGVRGDAHSGTTVKHRSRVRADPDQPNLRQVHLLPQELLDEIAAAGFTLNPGDLGENVLTRGIDLIDLPKGTRLRLGDDAEIEITGLRNPCAQIEQFQTGLLSQVVGKDEMGKIVRRAGVMSFVLAGGIVRPGDPITITLPPEPHEPLERV